MNFYLAFNSDMSELEVKTSPRKAHPDALETFTLRQPAKVELLHTLINEERTARNKRIALYAELKQDFRDFLPTLKQTYPEYFV